MSLPRTLQLAADTYRTMPAASPWLGAFDEEGVWRCGVCGEERPERLACVICAAAAMDARAVVHSENSNAASENEPANSQTRFEMTVVQDTPRATHEGLSDMLLSSTSLSVLEPDELAGVLTVAD